MVIIREKTQNSVIYVPKFFAATSALTFTLKSRLRNEEFSYFPEDLSGLTDYFTISIDVSNLNDGEYEYEMVDNGNEDLVVSTGLLRIGDYEAETEQYQYNQEYVEYNPDYSEENNEQYYTKNS